MSTRYSVLSTEYPKLLRYPPLSTAVTLSPRHDFVSLELSDKTGLASMNVGQTFLSAMNLRQTRMSAPRVLSASFKRIPWCRRLACVFPKQASRLHHGPESYLPRRHATLPSCHPLGKPNRAQSPCPTSA